MGEEGTHRCLVLWERGGALALPVGDDRPRAPPRGGGGRVTDIAWGREEGRREATLTLQQTVGEGKECGGGGVSACDRRPNPSGVGVEAALATPTPPDGLGWRVRKGAGKGQGMGVGRW